MGDPVSNGNQRLERGSHASRNGILLKENRVIQGDGRSGIGRSSGAVPVRSPLPGCQGHPPASPGAALQLSGGVEVDGQLREKDLGAQLLRRGDGEGGERWIVVSRRMDVPARYIRFHYDSFMGTGVSISRDNGKDLVAGRGVRGGQTARQPAAPSGRRPRADRGSAPRYKGWETGQLPPGVRRPGVPSGGNPPGSGSFHHLSFDDETVRAVSRFRAILVFPDALRGGGRHPPFG